MPEIDPPEVRSRLQRLGVVYRTVAVQLLGIGLLLLALNLLAIPVVRWLEPEPGALQYDLDKLLAVHPGYDETELRRLMLEGWGRAYRYRPFVQHVEEYFSGRYVNILPPGFRSIGEAQTPWPPAPDTAVFVFGGSTTFGYGVADDETIPAALWRSLRSACGRPIPVFNFGHGNYYSVQERVLLEELLLDGADPRAVVFIDGINEWKEEPKFTRGLEYLMSERPPQLSYRALRELPLAALLRKVVRRGDDETGNAGADPVEVAGRYVERWRLNRRLTQAVAETAGFPALFVWQPSPTYRYDLARHPFIDAEAPLRWQERMSAAGYAQMSALRSAPESELTYDDFLWLGDLQEGREEALYVDRVHYTAAFGAEIADRIAQRLGGPLGCGAWGEG